MTQKILTSYKSYFIYSYLVRGMSSTNTRISFLICSNFRLGWRERCFFFRNSWHKLAFDIWKLLISDIWNSIQFIFKLETFIRLCIYVFFLFGCQLAEGIDLFPTSFSVVQYIHYSSLLMCNVYASMRHICTSFNKRWELYIGNARFRNYRYRQPKRKAHKYQTHIRYKIQQL